MPEDLDNHAEKLLSTFAENRDKMAIAPAGDITNARPRERLWEALFAAQKSRLKDLRKRIEPYRDWNGQEVRARDNISADKRVARFNEILERLKETGRAPELEKMSKREVDGLINLPTMATLLITEGKASYDLFFSFQVAHELQEALKVLKPVFTDHLNRRLCAERLPILESAIDRYYLPKYPRTPEQDYRLRFIHFALAEPIRALVLRPEDKPVTIAHFVAEMGNVESAWWAERKAALRDSVIEIFKLAGVGLPTKSSRTDVLDLAVAGVFRCRNCRCLVFGARAAILHPCREKRTISKQHDVYVALALARDRGQPEEVRSRREPTSKPSREVASFEPSRVPLFDLKRVSALVSAMGLNPAEATFEQLRESAARLVCRTCTPARCRTGHAAAEPRDIRIFGWEAAVWHIRDFHESSGRMPLWELVPERHMDAVRDAEAARISEEILLSGSIVWACFMCDWTGCNGALRHWRTRHDATSPDTAMMTVEKKMYPHPLENTVNVGPLTLNLPM
ncbi:uncharacterized protein BXZ73DRAFT_98614 [Epithele typhae]|uniref:uncharacterized protein n=1 Tax=Epithele typhae TaxID=378194 RepID=UPI002007CD64|nr:uncharacterized protein BXZ73DRAFT_98614 [Epithele typhae]KAH9940786.1 hypothetical protein BXZ73DRAFT_98614 [Epithele typhae]